MKTWILLLFVLFPVFMGISQRQLEEHTPNSYVEKTEISLAQGILDTWWRSKKEGPYYCDIFLTLKGQKIDSIHLVQIVQDDEPFKASLSLSKFNQNNDTIQVPFSEGKINKLLRFYLLPNFSILNGGDILLKIKTDGNWKDEWLYLEKNNEGVFRLYCKDKLKTKYEVEKIFVKLGFIFFIDEHQIFMKSPPH